MRRAAAKTAIGSIELGDLKRKAQALIEADHEDLKCVAPANESSLSTKGVPANTVHCAWRGSKATTILQLMKHGKRGNGDLS